MSHVWKKQALYHQDKFRNRCLLYTSKLVANKGFDTDKLQEDANSLETLSEIKNDIDYAYKHGINGTPSTMINGNVYVGVKTYNEFKDLSLIHICQIQPVLRQKNRILQVQVM